MNGKKKREKNSRVENTFFCTLKVSKITSDILFEKQFLKFFFCLGTQINTIVVITDFENGSLIAAVNTCSNSVELT